MACGVASIFSIFFRGCLVNVHNLCSPFMDIVFVRIAHMTNCPNYGAFVLPLSLDILWIYPFALSALEVVLLIVCQVRLYAG